MSSERLIKLALSSVVGLSVSFTVYRIWNRYASRSNVHNEVLLFPDSEFSCPKMSLSSLRDPNIQACKNQSCRRLHGRPGEANSSFIKFLRYLANAQKKVDLCIYMFTQATLADLLIDLKNSNVKIRIITDSTEDEGIGSQLERLGKEGFEIKSNKRCTGALMHHKFVIIDDELLLSGSFNWTNKAITNNYEAVLVTTASQIVEPFRNEFDKLWTIFIDHSTNFKKKAPWQIR